MKHDLINDALLKDSFHVKKILFPTDFSVCSEAPRQFSLSFAEQYKAELSAIHIMKNTAVGLPALFDNISVTLLNEQINGNIKNYMDKLFSDDDRKHVSISEVVKQGNIVESINEHARDIRADLIVMGTHGRQGIDHAIMGSVTEKIVRTAPCPVVTLRENPKRKKTKNILFTTDFSEYSFLALPFALNIARKFKAKLYQVYVVEPFVNDPANPNNHFPDDRLFEKVENSAYDLFNTLNKESENSGIEINQEVITGFAPHADIVEYVKKQAIDLIVIATHGHSGIKHMLLGSTTARIVRYAPCPVLSIKPLVPMHG